MKALPGRRRQRGIAVITAMLVVTIATILAVEITWQTNLDLRRTEGLLAWEQARQIGLGAETIAAQAFQEFISGESGTSETFNQADDAKACDESPFSYPLNEGGLTGGVTARICDVQGRFNLNNLGRFGKDEPEKAIVDQFARLLQAIVTRYELTDIEIEAVVAATIDWIDADGTPSFNGAEDDAYTSELPPYRAANYPFLSLSEWRAVRGVTPELFEAALLCRCLTAIIPTDGTPTPLNVLTAPEEVYLSLGDDVTDADAARWADPGSAGDDEVLFTEIKGSAASFNSMPTYLGKNSDYFELNGLVTIGTTNLAMYSLLQSTGNAVVPIRRQFGVEELRPVSDEEASEDDDDSEDPDPKDLEDLINADE